MTSAANVVLAAAIASAAAVAGCQTEPKPIPMMTVTQWEALPASERPVVFRDPDPQLGGGFASVHETDGLSRNPADCARWGCIDVNR